MLYYLLTAATLIAGGFTQKRIIELNRSKTTDDSIIIELNQIKNVDSDLPEVDMVDFSEERLPDSSASEPTLRFLSMPRVRLLCSV